MRSRRLLIASVLVGIGAVSHAHADYGGFTTPAITGAPSMTRVDHSGSITLGGTAQSLMSANASRHGCEIQNQSNGDLWVNDDGGTAAAGEPNLWLPAGAFYPCPLGGTSNAAMSIYGATTGQSFRAKEW